MTIGMNGKGIWNNIMFFKFKKKQEEEVYVISSEDVELEVKRFTPPAYAKWVVANKERVNSLSLG